MSKWRTRNIAVAAGITLAVAAQSGGAGLLGTANGAPTLKSASGLSVGQSAPAIGRANFGAPKLVNLSSAALLPARSGPLRKFGTLRMNGTDRDNVGPSTTSKSGATSSAPQPNVVSSILQNIAGTSNANSSCGCQPPDNNAAVGGNFDVETVNLALTVFNKNTSVVQSRVGLNTFLGTGDSLSDPRIFFDNTWKRWVLVVIVVPPLNQLPAMWVALSTSASPLNSWYIYRPTFSGGPFINGTILDYPEVGMDSDAIMIATNNFQPAGYANSTVVSFPKQRLYTGQGFGAGAFAVDYSTHPAFAGNNPQENSGSSYLLASLIPYSANGIDVFKMTNTAHSDSTALTFMGTAPASSFGAPNDGVQPGGGNTLDALDGRLQAVPYQLGNRVWWTRATGFPVVQYGYVDLTNIAGGSSFNTAYVAGSSYDWNPAIAAAPTSGGFRVWLQWAYTDPGNGTNVSTRVAPLKLLTTDPMPNLTGGVGSYTVATGSHGSNFRFGDYASISIDPNASGPCSAMQSALIINEQFAANSDWVTRLARIGNGC